MSTSSITDTTDFIQTTLSTKRQLHWVPHGKIVPADPYMEGTVRYGVKLMGEALTTVVATPRTYAFDTVFAHTNVMTTALRTDITAGCVVRLESWHRVVVSVSEIRAPNTPDVSGYGVSVSEPLPLGVQDPVVELIGFPIQCSSSYASGTQYLVIDSGHIVVAGDSLSVFDAETNTLKPWLRIASIVSETITEIGFRYCIRMESPLGFAIAESDRTVLKAIPAYACSSLQAPDCGLAALDFLGGKTFGTPKPSVLGFTGYSDDGSIVAELVGSTNMVVDFSTPRADGLAYWSQETGKTRPHQQGSMITFDSMGYWGTCFEFPESVPVSFGIGIQMHGSGVESLFVVTDTEEFVGVRTGSDINVNCEARTRTVIIRAKGVADSDASLDFINISPDVSRFSYSICQDLDANDEWFCSGLVLKPLFPDHRDVFSTVDSMVLDTGVELQ